MKKILTGIFVFILTLGSVVFADVVPDYPLVTFRDGTTLVVVAICVGIAFVLGLTAFIIIKLINKKNKK